MNHPTPFRQIQSLARCFLFVLLAIAPARLQAQSLSVAIQIPHKLTLADAEHILPDRNLTFPVAGAFAQHRFGNTKTAGGGHHRQIDFGNRVDADLVADAVPDF